MRHVEPRILHLIDVAGSGGAETVFCSLVRYFAGRGRNAAVVLPDTGWISRQLEDIGINVTVVRSRGSFNLRFMRQLARVATATEANVIVAHLLGSAVYAAIVARVLGIRVVAIFHGALDFRDPGRFAGVKRWLLQSRHVQVVAVSEGVREALASWGISQAKISVIRNGVDTDAFAGRNVSEADDRVVRVVPSRIIGSVGNIHPVKGYEFLLDVAAKVCAQMPDVTFFVAGEGDRAYEEQLVSLRDRLGLKNRFEFLGFRPATASLYRRMTMFVSTSTSEGMPLAFLEAMACGVPIVATANEGATRLLSETGGGVVLELRDADRMAEVIVNLLADRHQLERLGAVGRENVRQLYSLQATQRSYARLIDLLIYGEVNRADSDV